MSVIAHEIAFTASHFLVGSCRSVFLVVFSHCHSFCVHTGDHLPNALVLAQEMVLKDTQHKCTTACVSLFFSYRKPPKMAFKNSIYFVTDGSFTADGGLP